MEEKPMKARMGLLAHRIRIVALLDCGKNKMLQERGAKS
jgi:hypothetical protein